MLNHSSQFEENVLSQRQRRSSKKNSRNMKAYEKKRFENGSQEIKQFMIIDSVSPPTRSFQDPLASCFTDSPLKTSDLASNLLTSNFNFSHVTPSKHDYLIKETLPINDKDRLLRDILVRLNTYKRHWNNVKGIMGSSDPKLQLNNPFYYDYLNEKDDFTLKVLIQILYEEIENLSDFFEQNSLSQKENYDKMEQRLREKDSLCTSIVKETLEQKSTIAQYRAQIEESDKKSSEYINCISDLQRVLQNIFENIFSSKFELGSEKKLEIGNLIKNTLNNIQESTIDRTRRESSDQRKSEYSQQHFSPITSVKRELTYSDLMDVMNKDFKDSPPTENVNQTKNSPKADLKQLLFDNRYSSPQSNGRQDEDDFELKKHRRSFSFNKNSFASANISPNRGNQRISEELANMNNQLIQKAKGLEESLTQANKTIASLIEEKNSLEPIVRQLRIQKDELAIKLQAFDMRPTNNTNLEERLATFMSEGPNDELSKSLNFLDANTHTMREDLKAVLKIMKEAEEKIVSFHERTSYQTNFSYDNERPNSLKRINTASLSKIREGSDYSEEARGFFDNHLHLAGDAVEMLQNKLKNSQEIHKILIKQYENKVLDTIEKLEDMKGMCNLVLTTNQNMVRINEDHTPTRMRALHTELERKNANIQEKIKRIEKDQEVNRLELEELIRQEEFVEEFYKQDHQRTAFNDEKPQIKNESLIAENHELNEMVQMLSQEITSLKSQLKLQTVAERSVDHSPLLEPLSTRRLSRDSSHHATTLNEKQRGNPLNLINQNDFYYMLNAQATSLEALLS